MKATMSFGSIRIEAEGDAKEVFVELARAAEVFGQAKCGSCGSDHVLPTVRERDGNTFYEMQCQNCRCCLAFGQRRSDGALFPRRKRDENWLPNGGWIDPRQKQAASQDDSPF